MVWNKRWHVTNNLPGTRAFCAIVCRPPAVIAAETYDIAAQRDALEVAYGVDILRRSAVWLTLKESRASFRSNTSTTVRTGSNDSQR